MVSPNEKATYLLRLWRADPGTPWRILVENIPTREHKGIRTWSELLAFLRAEPSPADNPAEPPDTSTDTDASLR